MPEQLLIGIDVGTTNAKGGAFDPQGRVLAQASCPYGISRPRPGWAEQDPEHWWHAVLKVIEQLGDSVDLGAVVGIGVCSQVNTHLAIDAAGRPVGPAIVWQDQRCSSVAAELDAQLSEADRIRIWGRSATIDNSNLVARAAWLARNQPTEWARTRWWLSPKDYINFRLTGEIATDVISPVDLVGPNGRYLTELLGLQPGLEERVPELRPLTAVQGTVVARDTGLKQDCAVVVATMDAWGNLYGSGATVAGDAMEVAGTSEILGVLSTNANPTPGVVSFIPVDGLRLHAGPTQAGGDSLRWAAAANHLTIPEALDEATRAPAGSGGLVFLPYLSGERAPLWDAQAQGVLFGLSTDHGRPHILRAVLEGVAFSARHLLEEIETAAGMHPRELKSSGGGTQSDLWCQIKADVLGQSICRLKVAESGILGAALMAGVGTELLPDLAAAAKSMVHVDRVFTPDAERGRHYDELYGIYRSLYPALAETNRRLALFRMETAVDREVSLL